MRYFLFREILLKRGVRVVVEALSFFCFIRSERWKYIGDRDEFIDLDFIVFKLKYVM